MNYALRTLFLVCGMVLFFKKDFEYARKNYPVYIGSWKLYLPSWKLFVVVPAVLMLGTRYIYSPSNPIIQSIIYGVLTSGFYEEIFSRSLFVKYRMSICEFLFWNFISSCSFALMHAGFEQVPAPFLSYILERGHVEYSFMLGLIVYKTQRIELTMLMHSIGNLLRYTLPVLVFGCSTMPLFRVSYLIEILVLGFCRREKKLLASDDRGVLDA